MALRGLDIVYIGFCLLLFRHEIIVTLNSKDLKSLF